MTTDCDPPEYLTYREAADLFRVSVRTISRYVADDRLQVVLLPSGRPRLRRSEVMSLLGRPAA